MTVREFLNTCQMPWERVQVFHYVNPRDEIPESRASYNDMRQIPKETLEKHIDSWDVINVGDDEITLNIDV